MANYDKMYSLLFNAITDALEKLEKQNLGDAVSAGSAQPIWVGKKHPI